jgi:hypothetical protein
MLRILHAYVSFGVTHMWGTSQKYVCNRSKHVDG